MNQPDQEISLWDVAYCSCRVPPTRSIDKAWSLYPTSHPSYYVVKESEDRLEDGDAYLPHLVICLSLNFENSTIPISYTSRRQYQDSLLVFLDSIARTLFFVTRGLREGFVDGGHCVVGALCWRFCLSWRIATL